MAPSLRTRPSGERRVSNAQFEVVMSGGKRAMAGFFRILRIWALASIPLGVLVGKLLKANRRASVPPRDAKGG